MKAKIIVTLYTLKMLQGHFTQLITTKTTKTIAVYNEYLEELCRQPHLHVSREILCCTTRACRRPIARRTGFLPTCERSPFCRCPAGYARSRAVGTCSTVATGSDAEGLA